MPVSIKTKKKSLSPIVDGTPSKENSPYIFISVGTAPVNKALNVMERTGDVGLTNRFQSAMLYDINDDTTARIKRLGKAVGPNGGKETKIFIPSYIPSGTGFNRDEHGYEDSGQGLKDDYTRILYQMKERSEQLECPPQMIIMFMGFGSHGLLGWDIYQQARRTFPRAVFLVVVTIPDDPMVRMQGAKMWDEYATNIRSCDDKTVFLMIDDMRAHGDLQAFDHKLAVAIASVEQANSTSTKGAGALVDVVNGFRRHAKGRWLGLSVSDPILLPGGRKFTFVPPFLRYGIVNGKSRDLERLISNAVIDVNEPEWELGYYPVSNADIIRRIFVSIPAGKSVVNSFKQTLTRWVTYKSKPDQEQLQTISCAAANFSDAPRERYLSEVPNRTRWYSRGMRMVLWLVPLYWAWKGLTWLLLEKRKKLYCHVVSFYPLDTEEIPVESIPSVEKMLSGSTGTHQPEAVNAKRTVPSDEMSLEELSTLEPVYENGVTTVI